MNAKPVIMVRVYLHEQGSHRDEVMHYLHDNAHISGVTVYRGISGFGDSGEYRGANLLDLSLDLPLVVEFYDEEEKIEEVIEQLAKMVKPGHLVYWPAMTNP